MIRKNEIAVINVYLNGHQIDKVYSGQIQVFPDQQIENNFWLHVYKSDNTDVFCWCRQLSAVETDGHITSITYEVIQTQSAQPSDNYYILNNANIRKKSSSTGYDDVETTNGLDPDEVYDLIPQINEEIVVEFKFFYKYGLYINNMEGVYFGAGKTTDYDKMEFFFKPVNYGGASWFGVMNAPGDYNDFRLFGYSSSIYFDCGSGRIYNTRITNSYMLKVTLVSGGTCTQYYYNGSDHQGNLGTSGAFSNYTGSSKDILLGANAMYFYGFNGYKNGTLIDSIIVPDSYVEQGIYNKLYNSVKKQYITLSKTPASYQTNSYPYKGEYRFADGNILNDFSLSQETYTETVNRDVYTYRKVNVYDPLSEMYYDTGAKYVVSAVQYTEDPTIFYDQTTMRVQAYGNGTVILYIDGTQVQNPYFFTQPEQTTSYTVTATAQESGKHISNTVSQIITIRGSSSATPVFVKISDASEVNSGECDIIVVCDKFGLALDGTHVTARANGISVTIQQDGTIENTSEIANAVLHYNPSTLALTNVNGQYLGGNNSGATWIALSDTQASVNYQIVMSNNENKDNRPVVGNNKQTTRALLFNNGNTTETLNSTGYYFRWYTKTQNEQPGTTNSTYWPVYIYKLQS